MQTYPKKSNRPLPDKWDEQRTSAQLEDAYDEMFGEFTEDGILKVSPKVIKKIFKKGNK
jgi:hypothetical protein